MYDLAFVHTGKIGELFADVSMLLGLLFPLESLNQLSLDRIGPCQDGLRDQLYRMGLG